MARRRIFFGDDVATCKVCGRAFVKNRNGMMFSDKSAMLQVCVCSYTCFERDKQKRAMETKG